MIGIKVATRIKETDKSLKERSPISHLLKDFFSLFSLFMLNIVASNLTEDVIV